MQDSDRFAELVQFLSPVIDVDMAGRLEWGFFPVNDSTDSVKCIDGPDFAAIQVSAFTKMISEGNILLFRNQTEQLAGHARQYALR